MRTNGSLTEEKDKSGSAMVINLSMQKNYLLILNRIQVGFNELGERSRNQFTNKSNAQSEKILASD